ncbi:pilus assembly protein PilP [Flocculibacter collagenilyticus]|uniref:pilus assembly protein PilP n=1 Tax=Flocculibacter collagenilyticus TaxID=2744479 RepID=UPI0018F29F80|nr:pilus assembly protein PilP [Flocculibacter collagenilyticus]
MMRIAIISLALLLSGCFDDVTDLQKYMNKVKRNTPVGIEPMPEIKKFEHISYNAQVERSPFVAPKPEAVEDKLQQLQNCLAPDPRRRKHPLEKYALDNIQMKGTLGGGNTLWALIEASDGTLHRITNGDYLGLFHGRVKSVSEDKISLVELIPDGAGCWNERNTVVDMIEPEDVSGNE